MNGDFFDSGNIPVKRKALAVLLSFLIPGTGHMYLGLLTRGTSVMLLLALNIAAIVFFAAGPVEFNVFPVTLLSLLIPVHYVYNIFDAAHQTDVVNRSIRSRSFESPPVSAKDKPSGFVLSLLAAIVVLCSATAFGDVWRSMFAANAYVGGAVLLVVGALMLMKEIRSKNSK